MATFLTDTFTGTVGTALTAHTGELGATWALHPSFATGSIVLTNANRTRTGNSNVVLYYASGTPASADYTVAASLYFASLTGTTGPGGRWDTTANTGYYAYYDSTNTRWTLAKNVAGSITVLGTYAETITVGTTRVASLLMKGKLIALLVDGLCRISATDSSITAAGRAAVISNGATTDTTGIHFDTLGGDAVTPYRLVVCDGNSLTSGFGTATGANSYPAQLQNALGGGWLVANRGVAGQTTAQMEADAVVDIDALYDAGNLANILVGWEGTNDVYFNASSATAYANLVAYYTNRRAAGFKVVAATLLPRNDFPGTSTLPATQKTNHETRRAAVNASLVAGWTAYADALLNLAADTRIGDDGDEADTTYYQSDKTHLNATGMGIIAALAVPKIGSLTTVANPNALTMRLLAGSIKASAFGDDGRCTFYKADFATDAAPAGTTYNISGVTGTTAVAAGKLTFTAGASAGRWVRHPGVYPAAGHHYVRAKVSSWSAGNDPFVGVLYDPPAGNGLAGAANYRAGVVVTGSSGQANLVVTFGGSDQTVTSPNPVTLSPGDEVCLLVTWNEIWGWVKPAATGVWACVGFVKNIASINLRATDQIQAWQPSVGGNLSAGGSVSYASAQCGYGGFGPTRDYKWFVNKDGSPFARAGKYYALTTIASGDSFDANHAAVCEVDPVAGTIATVSHLFYRPAGTTNVTTAMYGGVVVYDATTDTYTIVTNGWGYETIGTGVNEWVATITGDGLFTNAVNVLAATKLTIYTNSGLGTPIGKSVYDGSVRYDATEGLWWMAAPETNTATGWTSFVPTLYKGSSLSALYRVTQAASDHGEGANLVKVGGVWYAIFSRDGGNWQAYDVATWTRTPLANWNNLGSLTVGTSGYCSHMPVLPVNEGANTRYYGLGFDETQVNGGNATKGLLFVLKSDEAPAGNEWPAAGPSVSPSASPPTVTGTTTTLAGGASGGATPYASHAWTTTAKPTGSNPVFSDPTIAGPVMTYDRAGSYTHSYTVTDANSATATGTVTVTVAQTLTTETVTPSAPTVAPGGTQQFAAAGADQFGQPMTATVTWSVPAGGGSVNSGGLYTAPGTPGSATVRATSGGVTGNAAVTVGVSVPGTGGGAFPFGFTVRF